MLNYNNECFFIIIFIYNIYYYLIINSYYVATWYQLGISWKIPIPIISTGTDIDT